VSQAGNIRRLGHIGLVARDVDRIAAFYCDVLGFKVSDRYSFPESSQCRNGVWLRCNSDHHTLSIFDLRVPVAEPPTRDLAPGLHHIAFEIESFHSLQHAARMVRERELPIQGQRTGGPGNQLRLYFWDPEDNMIELYWGLDQIGWDGRTRKYPPITDINLEDFDVDVWLASKEPVDPWGPSKDPDPTLTEAA
jgi:catechol-2,3-dioxygenase